jgi:hypothetical protein
LNPARRNPKTGQEVGKTKGLLETAMNGRSRKVLAIPAQGAEEDYFGRLFHGEIPRSG